MVRLLSIIAILYALLSLWMYQQTPLGQQPLLDAKENVVLAENILQGTSQPFYRAPLYAGFLSLLMRLDLSPQMFLAIGQLANVFFHLLTALLLGFSAHLIWRSRLAGAIAGMLWAFYPVSLYLSFDLLDTALGNLFGALGLFFLIRARLMRHPSSGFLSLASFSLAFLTRPHFLVWLAVGAFILFRELCYRRLSPKIFGISLLGALLILGGYSALEKARTGSWQIMPKQAAYNLYAANEKGANSEAFVQKVEFLDLPEGYNPARAQANYLYRQQTRSAGPLDQDKVSSYWKGKFWDELRSDPLPKISLYGQKLYRIFHLHEGYNNKTYTRQKKSNPWLAYNPLNFIIITLLAWIGFFLNQPRPRDAGYLLLLIAIYALAAAVFYASDRFRLPMVMPMVVLAGGVVMALRQIWVRYRIRPGVTLRFVGWRGSLIGLWAIVFSLPILGVGGLRSDGADYLLEAQAALNIGQNKQAKKLARFAVESQPQSQKAQRVLRKATYNQLIAGGLEAATTQDITRELKALESLRPLDDSLQYVQGYYRWLLQGSRESWHDLLADAEPSGLTQPQINALGAVIVTNALYPNEIALLQQLPNRPELIEIALASIGDSSSMSSLSARVGLAQARESVLSYRKLFDRRGFVRLNSKDAP